MGSQLSQVVRSDIEEGPRRTFVLEHQKLTALRVGQHDFNGLKQWTSDELYEPTKLLLLVQCDSLFMSDETMEVVWNRWHATAAFCNALRVVRLNVLKCVHNCTEAPIPVAIITRVGARPSPLIAKARHESHIACG
jgi:hypothetical protein